MLQHIERTHTDTGTGLGIREVALTVDVPAEEMMFHQHVLNAFLQRPLLLLLGKKKGKQCGDNPQMKQGMPLSQALREHDEKLD